MSAKIWTASSDKKLYEMDRFREEVTLHICKRIVWKEERAFRDVWRSMTFVQKGDSKR